MDSANALITSARNLMQAVALTVKAAYVACSAVSIAMEVLMVVKGNI